MDKPTRVETITALLPKLRRRARRLSRSPEQAEDLAQDAALLLWQALGRAETVEAPERYGMVILHNLARATWRRGQLTEPLEEDTAQTPSEALARLACVSVQQAIEKLPPAQQRLMSLVAAGETSPAELARLTGDPKNTVMSRLARARVQLRAEVGLASQASVHELM